MTESLKLPVVCDFDIHSDRYAWVNEKTQHLESSGTYASKDELEQS
jgi:hypothetical protein